MRKQELTDVTEIHLNCSDILYLLNFGILEVDMGENKIRILGETSELVIARKMILDTEED